MLSHFLNPDILITFQLKNSKYFFTDWNIFILKKSIVIIWELLESFGDMEEFFNGEFELTRDIKWLFDKLVRLSCL